MLIWSIVLFILPLINSYNVPPTGVTRSSVAELDGMITQCLLTLCKEWIAECHWFCDQSRRQDFSKRCLDCLGWRGEECKECFDL
ncbi:hypothetical protein PFISCL1PPCAC_2028 [Pristionchus fissidentatus]|uniref:CB1 cannabinoid receptor-interacting protein 1 n=1 Tax=Pristionchus fissidentatus TaxID=1538716 RepID=A0AAV5UW42_9BILA|nr:hypothetical protein PFISCL1PPCAC_2028 [Pristionchus fissidentatus]